MVVVRYVIFSPSAIFCVIEKIYTFLQLLIFRRNGYFQGLKTLAILGYNQNSTDNRVYLNDMPRINDETISTSANNWPKLSTIVLHNYVCGDQGQSATNFISSITNLKRFEIILKP